MNNNQGIAVQETNYEKKEQMMRRFEIAVAMTDTEIAMLDSKREVSITLEERVELLNGNRLKVDEAWLLYKEGIITYKEMMDNLFADLHSTTRTSQHAMDDDA